MIVAPAVIAVPFFNEAPFLEQTLDCLRRVPNDSGVKFLLSDNGSSDGSTEIAERFAKEDPRFTLIIQPYNIGAAANFQWTFENADCEFFMWLGAHDLIDSTYPAAAIARLRAQLDVSYAVPEFFAFVDDPSAYQPMKEAHYNFASERLMRYLQSVMQLVNCTMLNTFFRKSFAKSLVWRSTVGMDHVIISHLLWHGPAANVQGQGYYRRFPKKQRPPPVEFFFGRDSDGKSLPRLDLITYYIEDFQRLYSGHPILRDYLTNKMLEILEKRFGILSFDDERKTS